MTKKTAQLIREGDYAAEVEIELHDDGGDWSPTVGMVDILKLDRVRQALRPGDFDLAEKDARIFRLVPLKDEAVPALAFGENKQDGFKP